MNKNHRRLSRQPQSKQHEKKAHCPLEYRENRRHRLPRPVPRLPEKIPHPRELVERAHELGYAALALTDECSVAGVVRAHAAAKACGLPFIVGSEFRLAEGLRCVLLATNRRGYGQLSRLITAGRRAEIGRAHV